MNSLDAATVLRWFDAVPRAGRGLPQHLSGPLSAQERAALDAGRSAVLGALDAPTTSGSGSDAASVVGMSEDAAGWLADYLTAFAAGVAGARRAEHAEPGTASPLHLVAGLITGAAAVAGRPGAEELVVFANPDGRDDGIHAYFPSASAAAHQVGAAAADEAVNGVGLARVTQAAAQATPGHWSVGPSKDPVERIDQQRARLLVMLVGALATATSPAAPEVALAADAPGWQPACVERPERHAGSPLLAEITFLTADDAGATALVEHLQDRGIAFGTYPDPGSRGFHIHAEDPGTVIEGVFATVVPFDLRISQLP